MGASADTIWQVPAYLPYLQPPLTKEAINSAQNKIGFTLPNEFVNLLRKQNGGYIRFSLPQKVHDSIAGIGPHFPSLTGFDWEESQEYVSYSLKGLVPFDGDGHWHICLDYRRNSDSPSVTYADIECDCESHIADSFADYLSMLELDACNYYVLEKMADIESLRAELSARLNAIFDPTETWTSGYPIDRARVGSRDNVAWIWISPNKVPRGFVRPEDPRYNELKELMTGTASRFPEVPDDSYLLSASDGVLSKVLEACARSHVVVRPLREYL